MMMKTKAWQLTVLLILGLMIFGITGLTIAAKDEQPVRLAYSGNIYEAPLFTAFQKGFFKAEGLKVELIKTNFGSLTQQITSGQIDGTTVDYRIFSLLSQGLKMKLIAGLHSNCVRIITVTGSPIKTVRDLKNKIIGVEAIGNGPMVVTSRLLRSTGINTSQQLTWKVIPTGDLNNALTAGKIDAAAVWESVQSAPTSSNITIIFSTSRNKTFLHNQNSYQHFYGSFIGLSERLIKKEPQKAAAISRAWLQAAQWVGENPAAAVRITMNQPNIEDNSHAAEQLRSYMWMPGVRFARENIRFYILEQKELRILNPKIDANRLFNRVYEPIIPDLNDR
jgi:ABC-type nitrate/sulfonate/bicarbonate transport system substrate-binding protein